MGARCILLLGGSFDPVHNGHLGLASRFGALLQPDALRLIPAGRPWQKPGLRTPADDRVAMLELAFANWPLPVEVDRQEIEREGASYTVDTLRALRAELGDEASLALAMGADQLQNLHTWRDWQRLFDHAHLCVASRPGSALQAAPEVGKEFARRAATAAQIRGAPHGLAYVDDQLAFDVSATALREALRTGKPAGGMLPAPVLDYIQQHHLYRT